MKKVILLLLLATSIIAFGQEKKETTIFDRKHEVKIGAIKLLAGPIFEGTYEYIYSKDFTFGSSLLVNLNDKNTYYEDFSITPFARFYFQESKEYGAQGFFVESFGKFSAGKNHRNDFNYDRERYRYSAAALGFSLGKKWINTTGFVFETLIGAGRTLGNSDVAPDAFFRGDLFIGYRF
jgi:hypothetical protein